MLYRLLYDDLDVHGAARDCIDREHRLGGLREETEGEEGWEGEVGDYSTDYLGGEKEEGGEAR